LSDDPVNPPPPPASPNHGFLVAGIGASAGGISALRKFFSRVASDSGLAYIVVLHLSPLHASNLAGVIQPESKIPVIQVTRTVTIEPNHVYVNPPAKNLIVSDGRISLVDPDSVQGSHTSIDMFLRSLAEAYQDRAVAMVLSGTGTDGVLGLGSVKEAGGFTIAQDLEEAEYDGMPRSAIEAGLVDLVLPVADMAAKLRSLSENTHGVMAAVQVEEKEISPEDLDSALIDKVLTLVRQRTGHDFGNYKRPTMLRRIARRIRVHELPGVTAYLDFLHTNADECSALLRDLLITVTNFFRDREAFDVLEREVIPKRFDGKDPRDQVRAWVVGCATGEEAYSIAITLCEQAALLANPPQLQIFATDIDEMAIGRARLCHYPETIALDVSPERLRRFFTKRGDEYWVRKEVRESILFAAHNILRDPPFSRLDLISCRNLLIYLNPEMQEQVLATFHFALAPDGYLMLGASESAESTPELFAPSNNKNRIYRRRTVITPLRHRIRQGRADDEWSMRIPRIPGTIDPPRGLSFAELHRQVVEQVGPPSCLVNETYDLVHISEHAGRYLHFPDGEPSRNLLIVVHPDLRLDLRALLLMVEAHPSDRVTAAESRRVHLEFEGKAAVVNLSVRRVMTEPSLARGFFLVTFDEVAETAALGAELRGDPGAPEIEIVAQLEHELQTTREQLYLTIGQYETLTEELKASNEELQAMNEELRSTAEDLETSKEELQSLNEELSTVNQELRDKIEELGRSNSDLQNLMSSADNGTIFLDLNLRIKLYTTRAQELFSITPADIGRPLEHFTHKLEYQALANDAAVVLQTLQRRDREVHGSDGRWYLARLLPYRTLANQIDGVVLNFIDISEHLSAIELRRQSVILQEQSQILGLANVFISDPDDRIVLWNPGCERLFGYSKVEALGQISHELLASEFKIPLAEMKAELFARGSWEGELMQVTRSGERLSVANRLVLHRNDAGDPSAILHVCHDVTARKKAEDDLRLADQYKDQFLATLAHELRNPLGAILGSLELLGDGQENQQTMTLARGVIDRQFALLMRLVDDLLDLERMRRGKIELHQERLDLASVVHGAIEAAGPVLEPHMDAMKLSMPVAGVWVDADRVRLTQVVSNLLHNAAKYTPPGGRIGLSVEVTDSAAVLRVNDTGSGISPEALSQIFELFAQERPLSESSRRGLGVGLALARQLVELHEGTIEARSAGHGKGSEFIVRIPLSPSLSKPMPIEPAGQEPPAKTINRHRVLVIDDERDVADSFANVLRRSGHQVSTAYSGMEGIETATQAHPTVALIDISMPDMDGFQVARRLRDSMPDIFLIAVSGLIQESDQRVRAAGFDRHLAKPVSGKQIEALFP